MTAHYKIVFLFIGEVMSFLGLCFCLGGDFFDGFWWWCGGHCPAYPRAYCHYGYECNGDWGGDEPEVHFCGCPEVKKGDDVGIVEE
jgi:hypothetical protein